MGNHNENTTANDEAIVQLYLKFVHCIAFTITTKIVCARTDTQNKKEKNVRPGSFKVSIGSRSGLFGDLVSYWCEFSPRSMYGLHCFVLPQFRQPDFKTQFQMGCGSPSMAMENYSSSADFHKVCNPMFSEESRLLSPTQKT